jgi:hypothetical protein
MKSDIRELVSRLREEVVGLNGWQLVCNGAGILAVPVVDDWEAHYHCSPEDEPASQEPEPEAHDPSDFYLRAFGIRLEKPR